MQNNEVLLQNYKILIKKIDEYNEQYESKSKLLLVSKNLEQGQIEHIIINTKQRIFGENKVQDAIDKWSDIKENHPNIKLHLIGKLQTNKIKKAVKLFDVIETIDSVELACKVIDEALKINKKIQIFLQINIGNEPHKNGIMLKDFDKIFNEVNNDVTNIAGIMCVPPISGPAFFYFGYMNKIAKEHKISEISMGMSTDFETAIKFGSTQVRIGSFITASESKN
ncbi:MAG: YggS family pyridoxal phosphate-dependent enzyme [Candidatus Midichloriaceae bacterium]